MITDVPVEQLAEAINDCALELLAEGRIDRPPVDAAILAERLGLVVAQDQQTEVRARFVRLAESHSSGRGTIFLAGDSRPERRQWAIAHEIGEFAAHRAISMSGNQVTDILPAEREQLANQLANALLLPFEWFRADGFAVDWDLHELKQIYTTASHELIARRMLDMSPTVIVSLFDHGKLIWRRSNAHRCPPPLTSTEWRTWRKTHETGQVAQYECYSLPEGLRDVRCWPVHESDWRREILRTALEVW